ncbi:MAG: LytTR family DNA-binding domain-containing protein [Eubacteriales bacterium]|nr:LytTR family DNA-binding domain-containing protein [Eubacteriales bacterium]
MLKIVICDDRKEDRDSMYQYVQQFCQERMLQAEIKVFDHPDAMICSCEKIRPHIYILDIVMPMVNGIQAARELRWNQPDAQIIFATSEESFALESFDVNPINYILKPVKREKLFETLSLAIKRISLEEENTVTIKVKGGYRTLHMDDIMYMDYRNHVVSYHLLSGETISTSTLRIGFAEYLKQHYSEEDFVLCHESVAVGIRAIDKLTKTEIMVRNREILPVSKSRYALVSEKYMNYRFR